MKRVNLAACWSFLKAAGLEWRDNKAQRLAAALAYYTMFSLAPLLIVIIGMVGSVFGQQRAEGEIVEQIQRLFGEASARSIELLIRSVGLLATDKVTTAIGIFGLLFGATGMFNHLKDSLNTIWGVAPHPNRGAVRGYLIDRMLALIVVLALGLVALIVILGSVVLSRLGPDLATLLPGLPEVALVRSAQVVVTFLVVLFAVALIYKVLPDATIAWNDVWIGAAITAALIVAVQGLIGFYLRALHLGSPASLIGAAVMILVWVYCSAMSFFFGAECTWIYANRHGSRIVPAEGAVALPLETYAMQGLLRDEELEAIARAREVGGAYEHEE